MSQMNWLFTFAAVGILVFGGVGYQATAQSDNAQSDGARSDNAQSDEAPAEKPMMQCPMMQAMKSIDLHANSPDVLIARAEQLNLSQEQREKLRAISENARRQAQGVLNEGQLQQLEAGKSGPLTPMELVKLVTQEQRQATESGEKTMCPMCEKMMERKKAK